MHSISIIGIGYVGLVTGTCLSEFGLHVTCMDNDEQKILALKQGNIPIYEPGLDLLVAKNRREGRLRFTSDMKEAVDESAVIVIAVGTPAEDDGSVDLQYVFSAAKSIANLMNEYKLIVNKSTVPVGTGRKVKELVRAVIDGRGLGIDFEVVSNPEFLREGSAIHDFMHPDRIVIGSENERGKNILRDIYAVLKLVDTPFIFTSLETAELIKYATNAFLATKITFINEIANLCDAVKADIHDVAKAMGLDGRIGRYFLHPGPGFGGSCLPKDTRALVNIGHEYQVNMTLVDSVVKANEFQKKLMVNKIEKKIGDLRNKTIGILGLAFKPGTDDIREAASIPIIKDLHGKGSRVRVYDPAAMENAKRSAFKGISYLESSQFDEIPDNDIRKGLIRLIYCNDEYNTAKGADALVILTEWNQFRHLDLGKIRDLMKGRYFFDFRNVYAPSDMAELNFIYEGIGR